MTPPTTAPRDRIALLWLAMIPLGFCLKFYPGPGGWLMNNWGASVPYVLLWVLAGFAAFPVWRAIVPICVAVCLLVCGLEFAQLSRAAWLQALREPFLGRMLLGNAFAWSDLPAYPIGVAVGAEACRRLPGRPPLPRGVTAAAALAIVVLGAAAMLGVRSWRDAVRSRVPDAVQTDVDRSRHDEHP